MVVFQNSINPNHGRGKSNPNHLGIATNTSETATGASIINAFEKLLRCFVERNGGNMPYHIIVYRDGVADNQFEAMLDSEYAAIREAVDLAGYTEDCVKISIIVCQKRHHSRFAYQTARGGDFMNPCVGRAAWGEMTLWGASSAPT